MAGGDTQPWRTNNTETKTALYQRNGFGFSAKGNCQRCDGIFKGSLGDK